MRSFFACIIAITCNATTYGQEKGDQLILALRQAKSDSQKTTLYTKIYRYFMASNLDSAEKYTQQGLAYFTAHVYKPGIANMLICKGGLYSQTGMLDIAKKTEDEAILLFNELNDPIGKARAYSILGIVEGKRGNFIESKQYFLNALKIFEEKKDKKGIGDIYLKLGVANFYEGNGDKALEYYKKALAEMQPGEINATVLYILNNIGTAYAKKGQLDSGRKYIARALQLCEGPAYANFRITPLCNMGNFYEMSGDVNKALEYYNEALVLAGNEKLSEESVRILLVIGKVKIKTNPAEAEALMLDALNKARETDQKNILADVLDGLIMLYKTQHNYEKAFTYLEQQKQLSDLLFDLDREKMNGNLEAMYDLEHINAKMHKLELDRQAEQSRKNIVIFVALILTVGLTVLIFFLLKTRKLNTQLHKREDELDKSNQVKDKLFSVIGHDLAGPMGAMPVVLNICRTQNMPEEEKSKMLGLLERNATASYETLQNLLSWGKSQIKGITLQQTNFDANNAAGSERRLIVSAAEDKSIEITNNIAEGIMVFADINHYKFIMRNLLSNAVKYTNIGGRITINATTDGKGYVVFSIKDQGIGISAGDCAQLFDSLGKSIPGTANEAGNGLGLKLCKEFVEQNGGRIWVESEQGKGSTFYFTLREGK